MRNIVFSSWKFRYLELTVILCQVVHLFSQSVNEDGTIFDFKNQPTYFTEFTINIPGWQEDCFYQPVNPGAMFEVSYQVLSGLRTVDFYLRDPQGQVIQYDNYSKKGTYTVKDSREGAYAICFYNVDNKFSGVLVYVSMYIYQEPVSTQDDTLDGSLKLIDNITETAMNMGNMFFEVFRHQIRNRLRFRRDLAFLEANVSYIQKWSCLQCLITVAAAVIQVFSLRWLFRAPRLASAGTKLRA